MLTKLDHINPDGTVVQIWIGDGARIGNYASIGDDDDTLYPICLSQMSVSADILGWSVTMTAKNMAIGCQFHPLTEWFAFDDEQIARMDRNALAWWRTFRPALHALATARGWL